MRKLVVSLFAALVCAMLSVQSAIADVDRTRVNAFLEITGFGVALESIKLSAGSAPSMLGMDEDNFGGQWAIMTQRVFDEAHIKSMAADILVQTLDGNLLDHAMAFYSSDLGTRLVEAENLSHMIADEALKSEAGKAIISGLVKIGSHRLKSLDRMTRAIGGTDSSLRAIVEIQTRFLTAASAAGVTDAVLDEDLLREVLQLQTEVMRDEIQLSALGGAAYTYQSFSDAEIKAYASALEHPMMQRVYELMNAVQFEVMANRFEALAVAMSKLQPVTDL